MLARDGPVMSEYNLWDEEQEEVKKYLRETLGRILAIPLLKKYKFL